MNTDGHSGTFFSYRQAWAKAIGHSPTPAWVRELACRLSHFVVENAKTARAELKRLEHPLPMRELDIRSSRPRQARKISRRCFAPLLGARISA